MFFYLGDFLHTMVLAEKEHIYFGSHDNFYLIFAMQLRTTLMYTLKANFTATVEALRQRFRNHIL